MESNGKNESILKNDEICQLECAKRLASFWDAKRFHRFVFPSNTFQPMEYLGNCIWMNYFEALMSDLAERFGYVNNDKEK